MNGSPRGDSPTLFTGKISYLRVPEPFFSADLDTTLLLKEGRVWPELRPGDVC